MKSMRGILMAAALAVMALAAGDVHAAQITVTVTDGAGGAAINKAVVAVVVGNAVVGAGITPASGVWSAQVPDAARAFVVVAKKLYAPQARQVALSGQVSASFALVRFGTEDFNRLGRIVGFVRNAAGEPLANATLVLFKGENPVGVTRVQNATGVYELDWYPPARYTVVVTAPGHNPATYQRKQIAAGESLWLDVTLQPR